MSIRVLALGVGFILQSSASFAGNTPEHMTITGRTSQPIGHYNYCKEYRSDCQIRSSKTEAPKLTRKRWNDLVEINAFSNNTIAPYTDQEIYNTEEYWAYPKSYGDCEDYVLMKRHMLMQRGWPPSSLLITVVRQPNGDGHAVLTVRTDKADYILDNLNGKIRPWNKTPYTYLKRQDERHSGRWASIQHKKS
ncbi:MAG: transglutaminase-like cysteine peptidase [Pseudomonadota bacterium]